MKNIGELIGNNVLPSQGGESVEVGYGTIGNLRMLINTAALKEDYPYKSDMEK